MPRREPLKRRARILRDAEATWRLHVRGVVVRETPKAVLIDVERGGRETMEVWFPKSVTEVLDDRDDGVRVLQVPYWLAKRKGLA